MAIEYPNSMAAACFIDPTSESIEALGTPFLRNDGFQAFDPNTSATSPADGSGIKGGFTEAEPGLYLMLMLEGIEFFEAAVHFGSYMQLGGGSLFGVGTPIPVVPGVTPDSIGQGNAVGIEISDVDNKPIEAVFDFVIWRVGTGGLTALEAGAIVNG